MTRYAEFDGEDDSATWQAAYEAGSDPDNHWPEARYLGYGINRAACHLGTGFAWGCFWLALGAVLFAAVWRAT